ncbi:MAG: lycopene cyclase family protein [Propionibacteriaceae bacterium]|nr:lycopene cyclase family protein [Propionibacteriaceae bacterium]
MFDVAIVGLGPAGRALASACADAGLRVLALDPNPDAVWTPTYGLWADELGDLPPSVVRSRVPHPQIRGRAAHDLARTYVVLNNAALQAALPLTDVTVERARLDDEAVAALARRARVVVDARGARPAGRLADDPTPHQTAYGIVLPAELAAPALGEAEGFLMDFTPDWAADPHRPEGTASFLYAIPLSDGRVLLEETCLAAAPGVPIDTLKERLRVRLERRGVDTEAITAPLEREVVRIPMLGRGEDPPPGVIAIGTAGRGGHPVSGYSVAHALATAPRLAATIAAGRTPEPDPTRPGDHVRSLALRALLRLDADTTIELFEAFGRLRPDQQRAFLRRDGSARRVLGAMWGIFRRMPARAQRRLVVATFGR